MIDQITLILMQINFNLPDVTKLIQVILIPFAFVIRYAFVFIIFGFTLITTTFSDALGKTFVAFGIVGLLIKVFLVDTLNRIVGFIDLMALSRSALESIGISDVFVIELILKIANAVWAFAILIGVILYFIEFGNGDLKKRGHKLILRGILLFIVLQVLPLIMLDFRGSLL